MKINLSKRLAAVAAMVPHSYAAADIGTDHGYLPAYLIIHGIIPYVVASDIAAQPLEAARHLVELLGLDRKIDLRLGDGLQVLKPEEADTICIAGMGASTIINILKESFPVLSLTRRLVLQPMNRAGRLRKWLSDHNWRIVDEEIVFEDGIYYEIMAAEPGKSLLSLSEMEIGPILLQKNHPLLKQYIDVRVCKLEDIQRSMTRSGSQRVQEKKKELEEQLIMLKKVRECLPQ